MKIPEPQLLLVDIGNTRLKWATAGPRGPIRVGGEMATPTVKPAGITALARRFPHHRLVLASVVPKLGTAFRRAFMGRIQVVSGTSPALGLAFDYPRPAELGADRLAAAVAAHEAGRWPVIIVSCGTATAFTVLDERGRLCGGAIAPGLQTQLASLLGATAQLPAITLRAPRHALARSTKDAIRAGTMLNFQGGVKEIIRHLARELPRGRKARVLLTGGNARHLRGELGLPVKLRPLLVLEGLRIMGLRFRTGMI